MGAGLGPPGASSMPSKATFPGFGDSETYTPIPDSLFSGLLPRIADLTELRVVLYALWRIQHMDSELRALSREDFSEVELGLDAAQIDGGLQNAVADQILLMAGAARGRGTC